uniref:Uncharacterized protein n=1 Tax=Tetranychus urticae TaxID=32264 RepID=T1KSS8_TETUR
MKLSIVLIAIFFVSTISAAPVEGIINYITNLVKLWEGVLPAWDPEASLESNVLAYVFGPTGPGWDSNLSTDKNIDKILNSLKLGEPDVSIGQVITSLVGASMLPLPISSFFPKEEMAQQVAQDIFAKFLPGVNEDQPIGYDIEEWIHSFDDLKGLDGKEFIVNFLPKIFSQLNVSDVGPSNTLEEIAVRLAELLFDTLYNN